MQEAAAVAAAVAVYGAGSTSKRFILKEIELFLRRAREVVHHVAPTSHRHFERYIRGEKEDKIATIKGPACKI